jgi:hypothetical protein
LRSCEGDAAASTCAAPKAAQMTNATGMIICAAIATCFIGNRV